MAGTGVAVGLVQSRYGRHLTRYAHVRKWCKTREKAVVLALAFNSMGPRVSATAQGRLCAIRIDTHTYGRLPGGQKVGAA